MDPLSVAASVMGVAGGCLAICKTLNALKERFADSAITIGAICTQSSLIAAALAQLQNTLLHDPDGIARQLDCRPELGAAFDTALTSCVVVLSCIDREIKKLGVEEGEEVTLSARAKLMWHEPVMKEMLDQLRGQATAFTFLLQCLQLESLNDINRLLRSNNDVLTRVKAGSESLRQTHPEIDFPESILESTRTSVDAFGDGASSVGEEEFAFDDEVINTRAYRRAMAFARGKARIENSIRGKRQKTNPDTTTIVPEDSASMISTLVNPTSSWTARRRLSFSLVRLKSFGRPSRPVSVISSPTSVLHVTHVYYNPETGDFEGLPDEWKRFICPPHCTSEGRDEKLANDASKAAPMASVTDVTNGKIDFDEHIRENIVDTFSTPKTVLVPEQDKVAMNDI